MEFVLFSLLFVFGRKLEKNFLLCIAFFLFFQLVISKTGSKRKGIKGVQTNSFFVFHFLFFSSGNKEKSWFSDPCYGSTWDRRKTKSWFLHALLGECFNLPVVSLLFFVGERLTVWWGRDKLWSTIMGNFLTHPLWFFFPLFPLGIWTDRQEWKGKPSKTCPWVLLF
jgi:hypothetical protein